MAADFQDADSILEAPLHELAASILQRIARAPQPSRRNLVAEVLHVLDTPGLTNLQAALGAQRREAVQRAVAEGWDYLARHGLVSAEPLDRGDFVTRRGHDVLSGALAFPTEPHAGRPLSP
jgi:hypothetical protein